MTERQHFRGVLSKPKKLAYYRKSEIKLGEQNTKASSSTPCSPASAGTSRTTR